MWTSVSGLLAHGEKMNVIGNNISNVNTVGFKSQRMDFQDFVYQYMGTASGMGQVGRGTSIGIIMNDFDQGSLETTTSDTDVAIAGSGFFGVMPKTNKTMYYTRAGNFTFDADGFLVDPHGYVLQGWKIDREMQNSTSSALINRDTGGIVGTGLVTDVRLDTFTCPPRHTTSLTLPINLKMDNAISQDKSVNVDDPFFSLLKRWDATNPDTTKPLGDATYAYQTTIEVYDEGGRSHKLTVYFDRVVNEVGGQVVDNNSPNESYWEYIITMDPEDDLRDFSTLDPNAISTTPNVPVNLRGLLGAGTITFDSTGMMKDMSLFVPDAGGFWDSGTTPPSVDLSKFVSAPVNENGYPLIAPNFSGAPGQAAAYGYGNNTASGAPVIYDQPNQYAGGRLIALDFGLRNKTNTWSFPAGMPATGHPGAASMATRTAQDIRTTVTQTVNIPGWDNWINTGPSTPQWEPDTANPPAGVTYNAASGLTDSWLAPVGSLDPAYWTDNGDGSWTPILQGAAPTANTTTVIVPAANKQWTFGLDGKSELLPTAMTCLDGAYFEHPGKRQDGYTYGDLRYVNVNTEGILSASYSNGVTLQLFQLTLYEFPSKQNLRREGGNLFTETRESGIPSSGAAGTGVFGTTQGRSLEQSNADLAREFVNMITTQRGFQANSKSITTVDTMLDTVIQMKR
jgi:flagellar hook protein FlgE